MPYVIKTGPGGRFGNTPNALAEGDELVSSYAVATLEEARSAIQTDLCDWHNATGPDDPAIVATLDLSESGGTIGPLPDGTVIEVEQVTRQALRSRTDRPHATGTDAEIVAAFNAYNARSV